MSARVLVVDDVPANLKLLEARLNAEYFDVVTADDGAEALEICRRGRCDVVLLDVMMPGMSGLDVCRALKADPVTVHLPVIILTALDSTEDRIAGLEAGADDFLTKPVKDLALTARVRSLARLKTLTDELGARAAGANQLDESDWKIDEHAPARILLVEDRPGDRETIAAAIGREHEIVVEENPQEALFRAAETDFDLALVSLELQAHDGLRLCAQLRSLERTRQLPILAVDGPDTENRLVRALELGVNDYIHRPIDRNELKARIRTQMRRKRFADKLRDNVQLTLEMAITDGLTGLANRRYFERQFGVLFKEAIGRGRTLSLLVLDIDHFKAINDTFGHLAGDEVLKEFSRRLKTSVRGIDLTGRYGGEEFMVAMPDTDARVAALVAERLRTRISSERFPISSSTEPLSVTVSVGVATSSAGIGSARELVSQADKALYRAKKAGRNRVAPAA